MPLKQCCASGSLHTGTPTGKLGKVYGLETYTAQAPGASPKGIIVIIPDAFGLPLLNNQILADDYAKNGYTVVCVRPRDTEAALTKASICPISWTALSSQKKS